MKKHEILHQLNGKYLSICEVLYIPGGAGFLPSTVFAYVSRCPMFRVIPADDDTMDKKKFIRSKVSFRHCHHCISEKTTKDISGATECN